jgi:hypothetical protein
MLSLTAPTLLPIETVNWDALSPTYPYRFYMIRHFRQVAVYFSNGAEKTL